MAAKTPIRMGSLLLGPRKVNRGREYFSSPNSNDPRKSASTPARLSKGSRNRRIERRPFSATICVMKLLSMRLALIIRKVSGLHKRGLRCRLELTGIGDEVESCRLKRTQVTHADTFCRSNR